MATEKTKKQGSLVGAVVVAVGLVGVAGWLTATALAAHAADVKAGEASVDLERPAKDLKFQQQGELVAPVAWADKAKGTATVPVARAMDIVVKTLQENPAAATPAPPPPPEPAADADAGADAADGEGAPDAAPTTTDAATSDTDAGAPEPKKLPLSPPPTQPVVPPTPPAP
ncbi:MAG: hypothetical protein IPI67_03275 [Myxococcales bacterium]|nr:hypothetical protein [Myxococcales bacterium]